MRRILSASALAIALLLSGPAIAQEETTVAKQAMIVDYDTGQVLFEKNADEKMPTSSMSKVMTSYVISEALRSGKITMDTEFGVSEKAWRMQGSKMFIHVGDKVKVEDLFRGLVVQSGNDAAVALAEGLSGTEDAFAGTMNQMMQTLGMTNSHFVNASGWPDPEHYSTARDLAKLGVHLIRDYPEDYKYYSETEYTYNNIKQGNRNPLLYRNIGADGIKTGHTEDGGYGLIGTGVRNGRRVVMVLNGMKNMQERADESARLLEWALRSFENVSVFKTGEAVESAAVVMGKGVQVPMTVEKDILVTLPTSVRNDLKVDVAYDAPVMAPVHKGQKIGVVKVSVPRLEPMEVPLVAAEDVPKLGLFSGMAAKAKLIIGGTTK